jgi:hypothetical protein
MVIMSTCGPAAATADTQIDPSKFPPPAIRLTGSTGASERPRVAIDPQGMAIVVWQDARYGNREILWQKFDLMGVPQTSVQRLTETAASSVRPDVSCDASGGSHVVWQEGESNGVGQVYLGRRDLAGLRSQWDVSVLNFSGHARVAALSDGKADVTWYRRTATDQDTYYRRYTLKPSDPGAPYACQRRFNAGTIPDLVKDPAVALSGTGTATLLWLDLGTFFDYQLRQASIDFLCAGGASIPNSPGNDHPRPTIDIAGTRTERIFESGGQIHRLTPSNTTCQISASPGTACCPAVGTSTDTSYVVWQDTRNGNNDVYFCQYVNCTKITADLPLVQSSGSSEAPDLAVNHVNGEWVAVWQEDVAGNTEIFMTSSRLLSTPPNFIISGAAFDKAVYLNGADVAGITVTTQSFAGATTSLRLAATLETNLQEQASLGEDLFSLAPKASRISSFSWPVPARSEARELTLKLELYNGATLVASAEIPKAALGTPYTQSEIDAIIADNTTNECDPPLTECSMYLVGLVPGFGLPAALAGFKSDVCEMGRQWRDGDYMWAGVSGFKAVLPSVEMALRAIEGTSRVAKLATGHALGLFECAKQLIATGSILPKPAASRSIDSLAAYVGTLYSEQGKPFSNQVFLQGEADLRIGVAGQWTTQDTVALREVFVFPKAAGYGWGHVGPQPVPVGGGTNAESSIDVRIRSSASGPVDFGVLHSAPGKPTSWIRFDTFMMTAASAAWIHLSDETTVFSLYLDNDGDGVADQVFQPTTGVSPDVPGEGRLTLRPPQPNPARDEARIQFELPAQGVIDLAVYDAAGRRVVRLAQGARGPGLQTVVWRLEKDGEAHRPTGLYFVRLITQWGTKTSRIVLL